MANPSWYQYCPLENPAHYRLLKLYTDGGKPPLRAELLEREIADSNEYECLSYSCGAGKPIYGINISGKELPITETVLDAILSIRLLYKDRPSVLLWIDSICINQSDQKEKSEQVAQMARIYSLARQVIVYFGTQSEGSEKVPKLCLDIRAGFVAFETSAPAHRLLGGRMSYMRDDEYEALGIPRRKDPVWEVMCAFLRRAWFTRTWIMQEAVLAHKWLFVCGDWACDGRHIMVAWDVALSAMLPIVNVSPAIGTLKVLPELRALSQIRLMLELGWGLEDKKKYCLIDLLQQSRAALATDSRDYIYGLLGLSSGVDQQAISIDYSEPVKQLYLRVARHVVTQGQGPQLLYNILGIESQLGLPSWVPDWSAQGIPPFTLAPAVSNVPIDLPYVCAGGDLIGMQLGPDGRLICKAYLVDIVQELTELPLEAEVLARIAEDETSPGDKAGVRGALKYLPIFLQEMEELLKTRSAYPPDQVQEVVWRTAIWNRAIGRQTKAPASVAELFDNLTWLVSMNKEENLKRYVRAKLRALDEKMGVFVPFAEAQPIVMKEVHELIENSCMIGQWAETLCMRMRRCLTKKGYLGHVPKVARSGDHVCVVAGAAIPFVLRVTEGGYRLVGQCYLHGFMEGEALNMPDLEAENVVLI